MLFCDCGLCKYTVAHAHFISLEMTFSMLTVLQLEHWRSLVYNLFPSQNLLNDRKTIAVLQQCDIGKNDWHLIVQKTDDKIPTRDS